MMFDKVVVGFETAFLDGRFGSIVKAVFNLLKIELNTCISLAWCMYDYNGISWTRLENKWSVLHNE